MKKAMIFSLLFALAAVALAAQVPKAKGAAKPKGEAPKAAKADAAGQEEVAVLQTKLGTIVIQFFPDKAPNHVKNFKELCKSGFYNGTKFHRTIPGFMIQGGDPNTKSDNRAMWGQGGNKKDGKEANLKAEFNDIHHARGIVSMARANDPNSASSQFFICVADARSMDGQYTVLGKAIEGLDRQYTVFGEVIEGMDVADKIVAGKTNGDQAVDPVAIVKARVEKRAPKAASPAKAAPKTAKTP